MKIDVSGLYDLRMFIFFAIGTFHYNDLGTLENFKKICLLSYYKAKKFSILLRSPYPKNFTLKNIPEV
jgi:hypothetical protein